MMEKPLLFYIHGFMSAGRSAKGQAFARRYGRHMAICLPSYTQQWPTLSVRALESLWRRRAAGHARGVLVGSSLGGFYAQYLASVTGWPAILINPALDLACLDKNDLLGCHVNPITGERVRVSEAWLEALAAFRVPPIEKALVLLCADDHVVRPSCAQRLYVEQGRVIVHPTGGHDCLPLSPLWEVVDDFLRKQGCLPDQVFLSS